MLFLQFVQCLCDIGNQVFWCFQFDIEVYQYFFVLLLLVYVVYVVGYVKVVCVILAVVDFEELQVVDEVVGLFFVVVWIEDY